MSSGLFEPGRLEEALRRRPAEALRQLADSIESGELKAFGGDVRGNGYLKSRHNRVCFDLSFSIEVKMPEPSIQTAAEDFVKTLLATGAKVECQTDLPNTASPVKA